MSIARACACDPSVLLLDEPAAGLGPNDTVRLGERIRDIAASGTGVLLVDHDIGLVFDVCDYIYVLDFGSVLVEGEAEVIRADQSFADAYLGTLESGGHVVSAGLDCVGLAGGWGQLTAFRDIDLSVEAGSMHAVLGPNGAGKTSLLLTLAGLLPAQAGTVSVGGESAAARSPHRRVPRRARPGPRQPPAVHHAHRRGEPPGARSTRQRTGSRRCTSCSRR